MNNKSVYELDLRRKARQRADDRLIDNPELRSEDHKYLFYILNSDSDLDKRQKANQYIEKVESKIDSGDKVVTDEVISSLLAIKYLGIETNLTHKLNDILKQFKEVRYPPTSDLNNILLLAECGELLSSEVLDLIIGNIEERLNDRNIPLYELIIVLVAKSKVDKSFSFTGEILSRIASYKVGDLSSEELIYLEWLYQSVLKPNLKEENIKPIKNFLQNLRKEYLLDLLQKIGDQAKENSIPEINLFGVTLLYKATIHMRNGFHVLSQKELDEKVSNATKGEQEKIRKRDVLLYQISALAVILFCALMVNILTGLDLARTPFQIKRFSISGVVGISTFVVLDLLFRMLEKSTYEIELLHRIWQWENISWVLKGIAGLIAFFITFLLL